MIRDFHLAVFAKAPHHGRVKTRLAPLLGPARCVALHRELLTLTLWQNRQLPEAGVEVWTPAPLQSRLLRRLAARLDLDLHLQRGNDLGQRMHHALADMLRRTRQPALLFGADCPFLTPAYLRQARDALRRQPFVFGPATDGGFVLVGARRPLPPRCFDAIEWGREDVLERVLGSMKKAGAAYTLLPALDDIDRPDDLHLLDRQRLHRVRWLFGVE